jgi:uncharacterized protein (TIGR02996 family)
VGQLTMGDGELLLRAILDQPKEDTPRLVYADWLEENGQPERAEFIRGAVLDPFGGQYTSDVAVARIHRAIVGIPTDWPETWGVQIHRGFVRWVQLSAADWFRHADAILAAHPVERVRFSRVPTESSAALRDFLEGGDFYRTRDAEGEPMRSHRWPDIAFELPPERFITAIYAGLTEADAGKSLREWWENHTQAHTQ